MVNVVLLLSALQSTFAAYLPDGDFGYPLLAPRFDESVCKRDVAVWHLRPGDGETIEAARSNDAIPKRTTSLSCPRSQLLKTRELASADGNVFNAVCRRQINGKKPRAQVVKLDVPINGNVQSINTPGTSGRVEMHADSYWVQDPNNPELREEEMAFHIVNRRRCPIAIEFDPPLRLVSNRRNDPGNSVAHVELQATPEERWHQGAFQCEVSDVQRIAQLAIAVRLVIEAFSWCGGPSN
ncbi:hypothetical protein CBER1_09932 [Cercospora berteroae]|uniref:Ig-like domain-containing protein n=1 Tax=Cercospora berteroae TaxID=357750 RepID=A0A2S6CCP1_9PEZI|nr:hypothetical protein CBER1_09932 [Cercospora berteroae]